MNPVVASVTIDRSPVEVFNYLRDISNQVEFADCYLTDVRLTRVESAGVGAAARFRIKRGRRTEWADLAITEASSPGLIRLRGATGRAGRVPLMMDYRLDGVGSGMTLVECAVWTQPESAVDRLVEAGLARPFRRSLRKALGRAQAILEGHGRVHKGTRPTVAGLDRHYVPNP